MKGGTNMTHIIRWLAIIGGTAFLVWGCKGFPVPYQPSRKRTRRSFGYGREIDL